jgi:hypothetical protein
VNARMAAVLAVTDTGELVAVMTNCPTGVSPEIRAQVEALGWALHDPPGPVPLLPLPSLAVLRPAQGGGYRWAGVNAGGHPRFGRAGWPDLTAAVKELHGKGWQVLTVCAGPGPLPAAGSRPADCVAAIDNGVLWVQEEGESWPKSA